jgi:hypothetical protein
LKLTNICRRHHELRLCGCRSAACHDFGSMCIGLHRLPQVHHVELD